MGSLGTLALGFQNVESRIRVLLVGSSQESAEVKPPRSAFVPVGDLSSLKQVCFIWFAAKDIHTKLP